MDNINTFDEVLQYMYAQLPMYQRQGISAFKKDLTNIAALCKALDNPQDKFKSIHVAGTNGKGTVSHIIAAGLQLQGLKVGLYTSPHYKDFRERIKINGQFIEKSSIVTFINDHKRLIEEIKPSFFEITVAIAFKWFADQQVDIAVIEVGLGGRLDSTNIIIPLLSVITNISFDHMDMLGNTLIEIAGEKAGIIKDQVPVVIGERQDEIFAVFENKAKQTHSSLTIASDRYQLTSTTLNDTSIQVDITKDGQKWINKMVTDLIAPYHGLNMVTALAALDQISSIIPIDFDKISKEIINLRDLTYYIGRWQVIANHPTVMIDSAHNEGGLKFVMEMLHQKKEDQLHIVLGFVNDKDLSKVLTLFPKEAIYYFAKANIPRGLDANELKIKAHQYGLQGKAYATVRRALAAAKKVCPDDGFIFVGGSIFVVAEVV